MGMKNNTSINFTKSVVFAAITAALYQPATSIAAEEESVDEGIEKIQVTATRRAATVQEIPVNITALDGDLMKDQNISELADIARWVPGLTVQDQGGRAGSPIIVRGLNTNSSGPDSDGGTVATYVGESPLNVDLKLIDIDRVEVLIGPQGTLYGAGTLGGAIRYIPNKPQLDEITAKIYGGYNSVAEGDNGHEAGFVFNLPLVEDEIGVRAAFQRQKNAGYIDYAYTVQEPGVSLPDPDWSDSSAVSANIESVDDVNFDETTTAKLMLRWMPNDDVDTLLSYTYQKQDVGGRSIVHYDTLSEENGLESQIGKYESAYRVVEPREKTTDLLALEITADIGIAELTSATSYSTFDAEGQRDQTDLLIRLDYGYEEFPAFTAFTREVDEEESFTQELRLVSTAESDLTWIVGYYYNDHNEKADSREFTPNFDQYALTVWETGGNPRPDGLEYLSISEVDIEEEALFGEISYAVNDKLDITVGARFYEYEVSSVSKVELPLFDAVFEGGSSTAINDDLSGIDAIEADDSGNLLKFNASYQFTDDVMGYITWSEGFRIGGSNSIGECSEEQLNSPNQVVCALPSEVIYFADTTENIEIGMKSSWFDNRLHVNGAIYSVDWKDPQIGGATLNGAQPITTNGEGAKATGLELSLRAMLTDELTAFGSFAYTKAELTDDAPYLFGSISDEMGIDENSTAEEIAEAARLQVWYDGQDGDRLPGSPEIQASLGLKYTTEFMSDYLLDVNYGLTYQDEVITTVGMRNDGEEIDGYSLSNLSVMVSNEEWSVTLYVNNLFDKYAVTSARRSQADIGLSSFDPYFNENRPDLSRNYGYYLATPRTIGVKFEYNFESF